MNYQDKYPNQNTSLKPISTLSKYIRTCLEGKSEEEMIDAEYKMRLYINLVKDISLCISPKDKNYKDKIAINKESEEIRGEIKIGNTVINKEGSSQGKLF